MPRPTPNLILGLGVAALAVLAAAIWLPNDSATWLIVKQRGRLSIGDAMAPMIAFGLIFLAGLLIALEKRTAEATRLTAANLRFLAVFAGLFLLSILLMRWSGPLMVAAGHALGATELSYRELRDTAPWKYAGFVLGGTFLVAALICTAERRFSWRAVLIGLISVAALIAIFDLPFPNLLLPPNGDV